MAMRTLDMVTIGQPARFDRRVGDVVCTAQTVLLLDDNEFDAAIARGLLEKFAGPKMRVSHTRSLRQAQDILSRNAFDVVILDVNLPDSRGVETIKDIVRTNSDVPIAVLTSDDAIQTGVEALRCGAQEYLPKSQLNMASLQRVMEHAIQRKAAESILKQKAYFDPLTGVPNRSLLYDRWRRALARAVRADRHIGLLVVDIDQFKSINDTHGHVVGDTVLQHFARFLSASVRETDVVARLGGDEFVVVLENVRNVAEVNAVRDKILSCMPLIMADGEVPLTYTASVGGAVSDVSQSDDLMETLRLADADMYEQKQSRH